MNSVLKLGIIGTDTSHVSTFCTHLHDAAHPWHLPGTKVVAAFPSFSPDVSASIYRVEGYRKELEETHGVKMVDSPAAVADASDAILLCSVDGRRHLPEFEAIAASGKPVFIDKPLAVTLADARAILDLSRCHHTPVMSTSALRYNEPMVNLLRKHASDLKGVDVYGPMALEATNPGFFWYGIHAVEMAFTALGPGCRRVRVTCNDSTDIAVGEWTEGRFAVIRGQRFGNNQFGGLLHLTGETHFFDVYKAQKPYFACLLQEVIQFFRTGIPSVALEETVGMVAFMEAANRSRVSGEWEAVEEI